MRSELSLTNTLGLENLQIYCEKFIVELENSWNNKNFHFLYYLSMIMDAELRNIRMGG